MNEKTKSEFSKVPAVTLAFWIMKIAATPKVEAFYWAAITFSQTLGTALGDCAADTGGLGYGDGALVFAGGLAVIVGLYYRTKVSRFCCSGWRLS